MKNMRPPLTSSNQHQGNQTKSDKQASKPQATKKAQYELENHMTSSNIFAAKKGLALLKRKMSKQKLSQPHNYNQPINSDKEQKSRAASKKEPEMEAKVKPSTAQNKPSAKTNQPLRPASHAQPNKAVHKPSQPISIQSNEDNRPLSKATDFLQLLEREI